MKLLLMSILKFRTISFHLYLFTITIKRVMAHLIKWFPKSFLNLFVNAIVSLFSREPMFEACRRRSDFECQSAKSEDNIESHLSISQIIRICSTISSLNCPRVASRSNAKHQTVNIPITFHDVIFPSKAFVSLHLVKITHDNIVAACQDVKYINNGKKCTNL